MIQGSLIAGGTLLPGFDGICWPELLQTRPIDPFGGGRLLSALEFTEEARMPMETKFGAELDGRLYTDLSKLTPENAITPVGQFFIRTAASRLLGDQTPWQVQVGGQVRRPFTLNPEELRKLAKPMGTHLLECSGNVRMAHFGMMSVASWSGVPVSEIIEDAKLKTGGTRVLISGFDRYESSSVSSVPGASWVFTLEELASAGAFLATEMNGELLTEDHGAPVRLVVPGWYGCASIKWVNEIAGVEEHVDATSQMQEYAARTLQKGVPQLARDYQPATIDQAAMPIRIEKWFVQERIKYRVVGILWGGARPVNVLEIRFNPEEEYVPVDHFQQTTNDPWSFWTHAWLPQRTGTYLIRLRVRDAGVTARRLHVGDYVRSVAIMEV